MRWPWEKERRGGKRLRSWIPWEAEVEEEGEGEEEGVLVAGEAGAGPGTPVELLVTGWRVLFVLALIFADDVAADVERDGAGDMEDGVGGEGAEG